MCRQHYTAAFILTENSCPISAVSLLAWGADQKLQEFTQRAGEAERARLLAHAGRALQQQGLGQRELFGLAGGSGHSRGS